MKTLHFVTIDSTNTYMLNHYEELEHYTFVSADVQTAGKGRNSRKWLSENGSNLLFSLLLLQPSFFARFKAISIVSAYSVMKVLQRYGVEGMIKWPNDVYVNGRKICGILLQGVSREKMECLVVGIGINVNQTVFDGDYMHQPTSVSLETGKKIDMDQFRNDIYTQLADDLNRLNDGYDFYEEIASCDYLKGRKCLAEIDNERRQVTVAGINREFELDVEFDGQRRSVGTGEITFHWDTSFD